MWKSLIAAAIIATLLLQCGCSAVGAGVGSMIDAGKPKQKSITGWQLTEIKPGTMTWMTLKDSSKIAGKLSAVILLDQNQFSGRYNDFRKRDSATALLPAVGDTLLLLPKNNGWLRGRLKDVSYLHKDSRLGFYFSVEQIDSSVLHHYRVDRITALRRSDGSILPGPQLSRLILDSSGIMPISAIEISSDAGKQTVAIENITQLTVPNPRHGLLTGFLIGVVLDGALVTIGLLVEESM